MASPPTTRHPTPVCLIHPSSPARRDLRPSAFILSDPPSPSTRQPTMNRLLSITILILGAVCFAGGANSKAKGAEPQRIPLWNGRAPVGDGKFAQEEAWITVHQPTKPNGAAIVICPGGGYSQLVTGPEGHGIAVWLN